MYYRFVKVMLKIKSHKIQTLISLKFCLWFVVDLFALFSVWKNVSKPLMFMYQVY